jgi:dihydropteroate synthase
MWSGSVAGKILRRVFKCGDRALMLGEKTYIMGILNVTPDSFSDGGKFLDPGAAIDHAKLMVEQGADIIDVGGESSRPGSEPVSVEDEKRRVIPVIRKLVKELDVPLSIDTYKSGVAKDALDAGACLVNDISGLRFSPDMASVVADAKASVVVMHIKGTPKTMQKDPKYKNVVKEVMDQLKAQTDLARKAGVPKDKILVDPGIGFGKTVEHNCRLIAEVGQLKKLGYPILIGTSRKTFIGKVLGTEVDDRLEGTIATNVVAVLGGVDFVRVHDVKEIKRALTMTDRLARGK